MADKEAEGPWIRLRAAPGIGISMIAAVLAVAVRPAGADQTILSLEHGVDRLDTAAPDWRATTLALAWRGAEHAWHAAWRDVERFGLADAQGLIGGRAALTEDLGVTVEVNASTEHAVLPEFGADLDLDLRVSRAVVLHLGARQARYPEDTAIAFAPGIELYHGDWRGAYTLINARLDDGASGTAHVVQLDRYYGDDSRVGIVGVAGGEATRIDAGTVVVADVTSAALTGRHWFGRCIGVSYVYGWTEQGDFYSRQSSGLGLLVRF